MTYIANKQPGSHGHGPGRRNSTEGLRGTKPGTTPTNNYLNGQGALHYGRGLYGEKLIQEQTVFQQQDTSGQGLSRRERALCALVSKPKHSTLHSPHLLFKTTHHSSLDLSQHPASTLREQLEIGTLFG